MLLVKVHTARLWGLEVESLQPDTCAAFIFYSIKLNFAILVFRGSSPFDLSEFLMDSTLHKIKPDPDVLPGMVHEVTMHFELAVKKFIILRRHFTIFFPGL